MWLTYSPIPNLVADFYHISVSDVDWFSMSYFVTSLVVGFISIAILDVFGLRLAVGFLGCSILLGSICVCVSVCLSVCLSVSMSKKRAYCSRVVYIFNFCMGIACQSMLISLYK